MLNAYYNEVDPFAAKWLRNLIAHGHIAGGDVDERSILEVSADDLRGYAQCHFFAGIGVWSHALRTAGWSDDRPVWTGSCPCQPFSAAGQGGEFGDERHLWPAWFRLIGECRPVVVFGEQVASKDALAWLDHVAVDLEGEGYAVGAVDTCAAGFGAPHIRQRLWFVANAEGQHREIQLQQRRPQQASAELGGAGGTGVVADTEDTKQPQDAATDRPEEGPQIELGGGGLFAGKLGNADDTRPQGRGERRDSAGQQPARAASVEGFWADLEWLPCADGKARPTQPGLFPLAHGASQRVGRLRAYGNAICALQAAEFVKAFMQ